MASFGILYDISASATPRKLPLPVIQKPADPFPTNAVFWASLASFSTAPDEAIVRKPSQFLKGRYLFAKAYYSAPKIPERSWEGRAAIDDPRAAEHLVKLPKVTVYSHPGRDARRSGFPQAMVVNAQYVWLPGHYENCETVLDLARRFEDRGWVRQPAFQEARGWPCSGTCVPEGLQALPNRTVLSLPGSDRAALLLSKSEGSIDDCIVEADVYFHEAPNRSDLERR